jgi:transcriptional regulator with XRE-family HTH domain
MAFLSDPERFGPNLRRIREQRGISLEELADRTNVEVEVWAAMERNDFSRWPRGIFARAFVREYARAIGVDAESAVDDFCRWFPQGDRRRDQIIRAEAELLGLPFQGGDDLVPARDRRRQTDQAAAHAAGAREAWLTRRARLGAAGLDVGVVVATGLTVAKLTGAAAWPALAGAALLYGPAGLVLFGTTPGAALIAAWLRHATRADLRRVPQTAFPRLRRSVRAARS